MPETPETRVQSLGQEDPLEEEMATHSSVLAWEIPWTEEPGGLQSVGPQSWTQLRAKPPPVQRKKGFYTVFFFFLQIFCKSKFVSKQTNKKRNIRKEIKAYFSRY